MINYAYIWCTIQITFYTHNRYVSDHCLMIYHILHDIFQCDVQSGACQSVCLKSAQHCSRNQNIYIIPNLNQHNLKQINIYTKKDAFKEFVWKANDQPRKRKRDWLFSFVKRPAIQYWYTIGQYQEGFTNYTVLLIYLVRTCCFT